LHFVDIFNEKTLLDGIMNISLFLPCKSENTLDGCQPKPHPQFFWSGRSVWSRSIEEFSNGRANQIARAGFIQWWTGDLQLHNHHVIKERLAWNGLLSATTKRCTTFLKQKQWCV